MLLLCLSMLFSEVNQISTLTYRFQNTVKNQTTNAIFSPLLRIKCIPQMYIYSYKNRQFRTVCYFYCLLLLRKWKRRLWALYSIVLYVTKPSVCQVYHYSAQYKITLNQQCHPKKAKTERSHKNNKTVQTFKSKMSLGYCYKIDAYISKDTLITIGVIRFG